MIKKYNQFIKDKTNEEFVFDREMPTMAPGQAPSKPDVRPDVKPDVRPQTEPRPVPPALIPDEGNSPLEAPAKAEMEEEAGDIYANKLQELADYLGVEVENNTVKYEGHEITFPSETEKYQIKGVKKGFNTVDEVVSELEKHLHSDPKMSVDEDDYHKGDLAFESKSYKYTRSKNLKRK